MALVDGFNLPPEYDETFFRDVRWGNEFVNQRLIMKERPLSRAQKALVVDTSVLPEVASLWSGLTDEQRQSWSDSGVYSVQSGYNLFVQDTSYRITNGLSGVATPSAYHQYKVARVDFSGFSSWQIRQVHLRDYVVPRRIPGTQDRFEPVSVHEEATFPLVVRFSLKSAVEPLGSDSFFFVLARLYYYEDSILKYTTKSYRLPDVADWSFVEWSVPEIAFPIEKYEIQFTWTISSGGFFFDNFSVVHSGQNWSIDHNCDTITPWKRDLGASLAPPWQSVAPVDYMPVSSYYPLSD